MAKRYTDTEKWKDNWFIDLSIKAKMLFIFLCDNCDIAGFYERSDQLMCFYLQVTTAELDNLTQEINKSVIYVDKTYFIKNFIFHQKNLPLNPLNNCHKSIITQLVRRQEVFNDFYREEFRGLLAPTEGLGRGYGKDKGKGKGKDKGNKGVLGGLATYSIQKDYEKWQPLPKKVTVTQKGNRVLPKKVTKCNPKGDTQNTIDNIQQTSICNNKDTIGDLLNKYSYIKDNTFYLEFNNYLQMRKKINKQATNRAIELALIELHKYDIETAKLMLQQSIFRSWQGIFPLKTEIKKYTVGGPETRILE